mmetsp:Transcript_65888/g.204107  ORF Transcript_65888/g.204107 Transcript_65888/m.204107 type:complete len:235 (-) Transcript_65888:113-817(-)|eukprot:CAMPEP_0204576758 /NCGR_PEP_ID=MMETSP0661-20131031/41952_1 /ASSEMBLY_ACC=CAM_ASM_000606 /TAXON_ID=109239 /ORGANISM="Alexandrium margalefi, Strain AMGDE01CS-322" /LENGTH=234 /DNA_ID=CAMNT_0051585531 /DNA_START=95 /DNA_END=799 /DNA_ORIENTATION=+
MGTCASAPASVSEELIEAGAPVFYYFPFAGRGEISRLCAAAGGLAIEEKNFTFSDDRAAICKECGGVGSSLPLLKHGELSMCQSSAIQNYICAIGPNFKDIPMRARAMDAMYFAHVEDMLADIGKSGFFAELFGGPPMKTEELKVAVEKWCGHLESQVPTDGFMAGLALPTGSDCFILCLYKAVAPWSFFFEKSGVSKDAFPKSKQLAERTAEAPGIKEYLAKSSSIGVNPFAK